MSLSHRYGILLIRPIVSSQNVMDDYTAFQCPVIISPCMRLEPVCGSPFVHTNESIIITSQNALHALTSLSKATRVYCVGEETAQQIQAQGFPHVVCYKTAPDLLRAVKPLSEAFLYLRGEIVTLDFSDLLTRCTSLIVYKTIPANCLSDDALSLITSSEKTIIPIYSHQSCQIVNQILKRHGVDLQKIILVSISKMCVQTINTSHFERVIISETPSHLGVLRALERYINQQDTAHGY